MPIFEYVCKDCQQSFEALVMGSRQAECPNCHGTNLGQRFSVFSASVKSTSAASSSCCAPSGGACGMGGCCMDN